MKLHILLYVVNPTMAKFPEKKFFLQNILSNSQCTFLCNSTPCISTCPYCPLNGDLHNQRTSMPFGTVEADVSS